MQSNSHSVRAASLPRSSGPPRAKPTVRAAAWCAAFALLAGGWAGCAASDGEGSVADAGAGAGGGGGRVDTGTGRPGGGGRPGEDPGDPTTDAGGGGTGDSNPGDGPRPDDFVPPDVDLGGPCSGAEDCEPGSACVDATCTPTCEGDLECPEFTVCQAGACRLLLCDTDSDCDDTSNPCTRGVCVDWVCQRDFLFGQLPDPTPGDCRRVTCADGMPQFVPDDTDRPPDDGIECTDVVCQNGIPLQRPINSRCDTGDPLLEGRCSIPDGGCIGVVPGWACEDAQPPEPWLDEEICGNGEDDNGNGLVDEGCPCDFGSVQRCYAGPRGTRGVGVCRDGQQQCINLASPSWGPCEGYTAPSTEVCDARDTDCNGCADDVPDCDGTTVCPAADSARPLTFYSLDADRILPAGGSNYSWQVRGPRNSATNRVETPASPQTRVYFDVSGDYEITLTATDDKGNRTACSWIVNVRGDGLRVEMRWDTYTRVDMDLHLHRPGSTRGFCTDDDCYYLNCIRRNSPLWDYPASTGALCPGGTGTCQNPRLDIDNISRSVPENINIDNPRDGDVFRVMAHKYSGTAVTHPVVSIYCGGLLKAVFGESPDRVPLTSDAPRCGGHTWRVADVRTLIDPVTGATDCEVTPLLPGGSWDVRTGSSAY